MKFVWDEPKRKRNIETHGLDFADVEVGFDFRSAFIQPTYPAGGGRLRFIAVGYLEDRLVTLVFSKLGTEAYSLISLRPASKKDRIRHEEATSRIRNH